MASSTASCWSRKSKDVAVGLGVVEHPVRPAERLDQAVVFEVLVDIKRVEIFGVKAGQEHVDDDGQVKLLAALPGQVGVGELLVLDTFLNVLVVAVELFDPVIGAEAPVVAGDDPLEGVLLQLGVVLVVLLFLRQVLLNLPDVGADVGRRGEDGGDVERDEVRVGQHATVLQGVEERVIFDRVVDRRGGEDGVEPPPAGGGVVLGEDGVDDGALGEGLAGLDGLAVGLEVVDVEAEDVAVLDRVGDRVFVQRVLKKVFGGLEGLDAAFDALGRGVGLEDRRAGEPEELGIGKEFLDGLNGCRRTESGGTRRR